jgi:diguanylate cyclase (GGDEF)-like protein
MTFLTGAWRIFSVNVHVKKLREKIMPRPSSLSTPSPRRLLSEWSVLAAVLVCGGLLSAYFAWSEQRLVEATETERLKTQARIIDQSLQQQFEAVHSAMDTVRMAVAASGPGCPRNCKLDQLQALKGAMPGVQALLVVGADGSPMHGGDRLHRPSLHDQALVHRIGRMSNPNRIYLSQPDEVAPGTFSVKLAMPLLAPARGAVIAVLSPAYFDVVMRSVLYTPDMRSAITQADGRRILFMPHAQSDGSYRAAPNAFFARHLRSGQLETVMTGNSIISHAPRLVVQRSLLPDSTRLDHTLVVTVSRGLGDLLAASRRLALMYCLAWLMLTLSGTVILLHVQRRRRELCAWEADRQAEHAAHGEHVAHLAFYDSLTDLPNRRLLRDRLDMALKKNERAHHVGAVLFIDLDNFKDLNDTLGHDIGDQLLQQVALRLRDATREGDTVARVGGDEFVILLEELAPGGDCGADQAAQVAGKVLAALSAPYYLDRRELHSTPSIGIVLFGGLHPTVDELLKQADMAMYGAKAAGRNTYRMFDPRMQALVDEHAALGGDLRHAVQRDELLLHYQPIVDHLGCMRCAEALVRWQHPRRGLVGPSQFIPVVEKSGLILPIGDWVLIEACRQLARWARAPATAALQLSVNISARQFRQHDFVDQVLGTLASSGADPRRLKLELTESILLHDVEDMIAKMRTLKASGVGFALDDFGTGYSSLSYLKRLPLDQLKIDQSFVHDMLHSSNAATIVRAVVSLAHSLGLDVVAEGVETKAQHDFLRDCGCALFQGFLYGPPTPVAQLRHPRSAASADSLPLTAPHLYLDELTS